MNHDLRKLCAHYKAQQQQEQTIEKPVLDIGIFTVVGMMGIATVIMVCKAFLFDLGVM